MKLQCAIAIVLPCCLCAPGTSWSDVSLWRGVVGAGGGRAIAAGFLLHGTAGQALIGRSLAPAGFNDAGFWWTERLANVGVESATPLAGAEPELRLESLNPARGVATLGLLLPRRTSVLLALFDVHGRRIETLLSGVQEPGDHRVQVGTASLSSGLYFACLGAEASTRTVRLVVLR